MTAGIVIAGTHSGCGKTTVALGLMAALTKRGHRIQGFKVGPDYIDPSFYKAITGRDGENLDTWMTGVDGVREIYREAAINADYAVVEGVMGLFDGAKATEEAGSTAELAKSLNLPVLLVVDARSMARSVAALVKGFTEFDPGLRFGGVIFNRVGSEKHFQILNEAVKSASPVNVLGYLPREGSIVLPERHLGLVPFYETPGLKKELDNLGELIEKHINIDELLTIFYRSTTLPASAADTCKSFPRARIGVARDRAFGFYYQDNLRLLQAAGAELVYFSPLEDPALPAGVDGLYLGGGYPEMFAARLGENCSLKNEILNLVGRGLPVYAECGGLIYLGKSLKTKDGLFPMVGALDIETEMGEKRAALGYVELTALNDNLLLKKGGTARGHEYHYSKIVNAIERENAFSTGSSQAAGFQRDNLLASYFHIHFRSNPQIAKEFVENCTKR